MTKETFKKALENKNIMVTKKMLDQFEKYMQLLLEWNQKMNLTAITIEEEIWEKHFYDSIVPFENLSHKTLCDVGSGAGFPGIVLKIVFPNTFKNLYAGYYWKLYVKERWIAASTAPCADCISASTILSLF